METQNGQSGPPSHDATGKNAQVRVNRELRVLGTTEIIRAVTIAEILTQSPAVEWIWDETIPLRNVVCLSARQKVGKSTLARNLMASIVKGEPFLDRPVQKGRILYLPLEGDLVEAADHLRQLGVPPTCDDLVFGTNVYASTKSDGAQTTEYRRHRASRGLKHLERHIKDVRPLLVVIDPLVLLMGFRNLNDYDRTYQDLRPLIQLAEDYDCAILFTHHEAKSNRANIGHRSLGSAAISAAVHSTISMQVRNGITVLESEARSGSRFEELALRYDDESGILLPAGKYMNAAIADMRDAILTAFRQFDRAAPPTRDQLLIQVKGTQVEKVAAFYHLHDSGHVERVAGTGKRGSPYRYWLYAGTEAVSHTGVQDSGSVEDDFDIDWAVQDGIPNLPGGPTVP